MDKKIYFIKYYALSPNGSITGTIYTAVKKFSETELLDFCAGLTIKKIKVIK